MRAGGRALLGGGQGQQAFAVLAGTVDRLRPRLRDDEPAPLSPYGVLLPRAERLRPHRRPGHGPEQHLIADLPRATRLPSAELRRLGSATAAAVKLLATDCSGRRR